VTIADRFAELRANNEKALVCFVTAGDPSLEQLPSILKCLDEAGADIIEVGIPFSDPIADGPVIQAAGQRALDSGVEMDAILKVLSKVTIKAPLVLMGYMNSALRQGLEHFAFRAELAGVSGVILSDLIPDEACEWIETASKYELDTIFLAAPTSTDERLDIVCQAAKGFVYAVSRAGVTGSQQSLSDEALELVARLRKRTDLPICVGFGISDAKQVAEVCKVADGAVIGSKLVQLIHDHWADGAGRDLIFQTVSDWKAATRI
jgi:tryptophan synthase alpha chain